MLAKDRTITEDTRISWRVLFEDDEDLIKHMLLCNVSGMHAIRGYEYIKSFQTFYIKNGYLTDKQMTQLKRLAKAIYLHLHGLGATLSYPV